MTPDANKAQENDRLLDDIFACLQDAILILDRDFNIFWVNANAEQYFSHMAPLIGKKCHQVIFGQYAPCEGCPSVKTMETWEPTRKIEGLRGITGEVIKWIEHNSFPLLDAQKKLSMGVILILRDITESKQLEMALQDSENRYRTLVEQIPAVTYIAALDQASTTLYISPQIESFIGFSPADYQADPDIWRKQLHPEDRERVLAQVEQCHKTGENFSSEYRLLSRDGQRMVWFRDLAKLIRDQDGKPCCLQGVMYDITERKEHEAELASYQERLKNLATEVSLVEARERRSLASDLHDHIGQVLALAKIKLGMLLQESPSPQMQDGLREVRNLVDQTIQYTRTLTIEIGLPILYELGLEDAIEWLAEQFQRQFGIRITLHRADQDKHLSEVEKIMLFRVVRELLANVVKHAQANGAMITCFREKNSYCINIRDDGVGFEVAKVEAKAKETGAFGIFSIRERLSYLGGQMEIQSIPGQGTTATVELPIQ